MKYEDITFPFAERNRERNFYSHNKVDDINRRKSTGERFWRNTQRDSPTDEGIYKKETRPNIAQVARENWWVEKIKYAEQTFKKRKIACFRKCEGDLFHICTVLLWKQFRAVLEHLLVVPGSRWPGEWKSKVHVVPASLIRIHINDCASCSVRRVLLTFIWMSSLWIWRFEWR